MARMLKADEAMINKLLEEIKKQCKGFLLNDDEVSVTLPQNDAEATVTFSELAWNKIKGLVTTCTKEIAWHCLMSRDGEGLFKVYDVIMFPQTVTACTVTSDETEYAKWIASLDDYTFNDMRGHMHSHVNMGVSPSATDLTYQQQVTQNEEDYYFFMILNKKGDFWTRIVDVKNNILYEDEDIQIEFPESDTQDWVNRAIGQYVKEQQTSKYTPKTSIYKEYQQDALRRIADAKKAEDDDDFVEDWWRGLAE